MSEGAAFVILGGKIIASDRCYGETLSVKGEVVDLWYSGKAHRHGGNVQAVALPGGFPIWISDAGPGCRPWPTTATTAPEPASKPS